MAEMTLEQQKAIALAEAKLRAEKERVVEKPTYDPTSAENILGAAVEPTVSMMTGIPASITAGVGGIGTALANLGSMGGTRIPKRDPADTVRAIQERGTYQPRTEGGQRALEAVTTPFRGLHNVAERLGEEVLERTGSPEAATIAQTIIEAAPMALGGAMGGPKRVLPKPRQAVENAILAAPKAIGELGGAIKHGVASRLPGSVEPTTSQAVSGMLGPKRAAVVEALRQAKPGETAGQAAVPARSPEFSALQRMAEQRKPAEYLDIRDAQQAQRVGQLGKIARTPEELTAAIKKRTETTTPIYKAAREGKVDVAPVVESVNKLIQDNPGNTVLQTELGKVMKGLVDEKGTVRTSAQQISSSIDGLKGAIANKDNAFIKGELTNIKNALAKSLPRYKEAQTVFKEMSKPINEMQIGAELVKSLEPILGSKERATVFARAVDNAKQTIKRGTGEPRFKTLEEALTPDQMKIVKTAKNQLERDALLSEMATKGNKATRDAINGIYDLPKVRILSRAMVIINTLLRKIETSKTESSLELITQKMKNPAEMAKFIEKSPPTEQVILSRAMEYMKQSIPIGGAAAMENE